MKHVYLPLLAATCLLSCGLRINYLGNAYGPTAHVDVYVDASAIRRPYTVMGKGYPEYALSPAAVTPTDKLQRKVVELARQKGADAVLFQDYFVRSEGAAFTALAKTDSAGHGFATGTVMPVLASGRTVFFLKYE